MSERPVLPSIQHPVHDFAWMLEVVLGYLNHTSSAYVYAHFLHLYKFIVKIIPIQLYKKLILELKSYKIMREHTASLTLELKSSKNSGISRAL